MKLFKKLLFLLLVVLGCVSTSVCAATTAPSSFTISASKTYMLYGSNYLGHGSTLNFTYKVNNDGKVVYCTEIHDTMTGTTETYTLSKEAAAGFASILENGYPNKSITGDKNKDYYITGLAIWYYISPNDSVFTYFNLSAGTYKGYSSDVVKHINNLVVKARNASYTTPSIKLNNPSSTLTLSSDGKYYVSSEMSVNAVNINGKYNVNLTNAPEGTLVVNTSGSSQTSFNSNEKFVVKVPVSSVSLSDVNFKVGVSAKGTINRAYIYAPTNAAHQSLVTIYPENVDVSDSASLGLTLETSVSISKLDIANDEELPGATLVIKDSNGKVVEEWVSGSEPKIITGLPFGTYTLTETIAPEGYVLSEETITFTLSASSLTASAVMYNSKEAPTKVSISKQDITNGEELPGAHLVIKDSEGNVVHEWVSGNEPEIIEGKLEKGKTYTLTETIAPEGYVLSEETIEFTVKEDGSVTSVVMYNAPSEVIVEVPKTSSFRTIIYSLIGVIVIGLGSIVIYRKLKVNE